MPDYQGVKLESLEVLRIMFGFFPTYRQVVAWCCRMHHKLWFTTSTMHHIREPPTIPQVLILASMR